MWFTQLKFADGTCLHWKQNHLGGSEFDSPEASQVQVRFRSRFNESMYSFVWVDSKLDLGPGVVFGAVCLSETLGLGWDGSTSGLSVGLGWLGTECTSGYVWLLFGVGLGLHGGRVAGSMLGLGLVGPSLSCACSAS